MVVYLSEYIYPKAAELLRQQATVVDTFDNIEEIDAIIVRGASVTAEMMDRAKKLKVIAKHGIGCNSIDVEAVDVTEPLETISPEGDEMVADSIDVNGDIVTYVPSYESASAPASGAGLWMGSDSTTDGSWGYFIGHNPGDFTCVMTLKNGDPVTVCDSDRNTRTYSVVDEFIVPDDTYWEDIQSRVTDYGESIILQTCCGDNAHYRVVIAA